MTVSCNILSNDVASKLCALADDYDLCRYIAFEPSLNLDYTRVFDFTQHAGPFADEDDALILEVLKR